jgi:hypothetical protein
MAMSCVFSEGHDVNGDVQMCQVWCGALCGPKLFCGLPHKEQLIRHFLSILHTNSWKLNHNVSKRTWIFACCLGTYLLHYTIRKSQHTGHTEQCLFPQNSFCFTILFHFLLKIFRFFEKHAQNLNTLQNNSVSWDLQMGFNSGFTGLKFTLILFSNLCLGLPSSLSLTSPHQNMHSKAKL